jgi:hypothetical protein
MPYSLYDGLCSNRGQQFTLGYLLTVVAANTTITYGEIADRLWADLSVDGKVFPTHIGSVVGTLMEGILKVDPSAPLINVLVVNQRTMQPSEGADGFLRRRFRLPPDPIQQERRRKLVAKAASAVYAYAGWRRIYRKLFKTEPPAIDPGIIVEGNDSGAEAEAESFAAQERGAGFQSNPEIRRVVEEYAMDRAQEKLSGLGFSKFKDTSKRHCYDYTCNRGGTLYYVEVKGTQGSGTSVILTKNEH